MDIDAESAPSLPPGSPCRPSLAPALPLAILQPCQSTNGALTILDCETSESRSRLYLLFHNQVVLRIQ